MNKIYLDILFITFILFISLFINCVNRVSLKNIKLKQYYLKLNSYVSLSKEAYIYILRVIIYFFIGAISIAMIIKLDAFNVMELYGNATSLYKGMVSVLLGIVVSMQMFFLTAILTIVFIMKKDLTTAITKVKWIEKNEKYKFYTKTFRPLILAAYESLVYCGVLYGVTKLYNLNYILIALALSIVYGLGKALLATSLELKVLMFSYGFWCLFVGTLIFGFTQNIFYVIALLWVNISFWVFKR